MMTVQMVEIKEAKWSGMMVEVETLETGEYMGHILTKAGKRSKAHRPFFTTPDRWAKVIKGAPATPAKAKTDEELMAEWGDKPITIHKKWKQ